MARKTHRSDDILWTITDEHIKQIQSVNVGASDATMVTLGSLLDTMYPRKAMAKLFEEKLIYVNDLKANPHTVVTVGDEVWIAMAKEKIDYSPAPMDLVVLYEDEDLLIVDKPAGLTVNSQNQISLANGVAQYFKDRGIKRKIRFLNRLDRDTTGCIVIAKSGLAQSLYQQQMDNDIFEKWYRATVEGVLVEPQGSLEFPMRKSADGIHYEVHSNGVMTRTDYKVVVPNHDSHAIIKNEMLDTASVDISRHLPGVVDKSVSNYGVIVDNVDNSVGNIEPNVGNISAAGDNSVYNCEDNHRNIPINSGTTAVDIRLWTGKTHQIRVAFSHCGHPLVGDTLYGAQPTGKPFKLRAVRVIFNHIRTGQRIEVQV
ncbi:MAG: RluA family pseudouridine synthase [Veillonella caviae]|uniref:RluA family pseudouridine synthase n=1 Tax=Veillonella caviae TaxID=248316 RepID=UPI002A91F93A|nr:RluA family pseudouridine synthase [Veillonella caviae]MDY5714452.1 RluA family pseudouridine synthase [Veillonella caviae]